MGQALYRKYRSKSFADIVGQDHITITLQNAIKSGKVSHAYLFTGPRGTGKTSVARILAHEVSELTYSDESAHLDIIEIDAASNRRIDEIRDLRDKVNIAPATSRYKVYIIDEVHMLTREAFNALLKTLEEPPAHCIFILATTEAHKLPDTIVSRTQRFEFKPVSQAQASEHLSKLAKREDIDIEKEALDLLAEFGNGSFRDSISYLDQLSSLDHKITVADVRQLLGLPSDQAVTSLVEALDLGNASGLLEQLTAIEQHGVTPTALASALSDKIRRLIINNQAQSWHYDLIKDLLSVGSSPRPQELLEITLLEQCRPSQKNTNHIASKRINNESADFSVTPTKNTDSSQQRIAPKPTKSNHPTNSQFSLGQWPTVVSLAKKEAASIYTALRLAKPIYEDGVLVLNFQFPLHQKKLDQSNNKQLVAKLIEEVSGAIVVIESVVNKTDNQTLVNVTQTDESLNTINNIFGASEMLEI
jgi:DNA polymerase-3 subunit gamma/tau